MPAGKGMTAAANNAPRKSHVIVTATRKEHAVRCIRSFREQGYAPRAIFNGNARWSVLIQVQR